jgi:hypothetical protein
MKKYLVILLLCSFKMYGQATRTWVSGVGDDANPCSRTAPCKTFTGALSKTAAGGEISALDPGGYGTVTITKSITISGDGTLANILASSTTGVVVNAGVNDKVILRNLSIEGARTGLSGIRFAVGRELIVENCSINNFTQNGINVDMASGNATMLISNSSFLDYENATGTSVGLRLLPAGSTANLKVSVVNSRLHAIDSAIVADGNTTLSVMNSVVSSNIAGVVGLGSAKMLLHNADITNNGTALISTASSEISLSSSAMTHNTVGASANNLIISFGNNAIRNNTTSAPLGVVRLD